MIPNGNPACNTISSIDPLEIRIPVRNDAEDFAIPACDTALAWVASWGIDLEGPDETDAEIEALAADGDESDPETWGEEWDEDRWAPNAPGRFEPSPEDLAELHELFPDDVQAEEWTMFTAWAERVDALARRTGLEPEHLARSIPGCTHESALV